MNHRYLEVSLRLPDELKPLEGDCRQRIGAELNRGKVDASVFLRSLGAAPTAVEIDPGALDSLLERVADVRSRLPEAAPINPLDVLRWPGVTREIERDPSEILAATRALLDATLAELTAAREREGARLRESVLQRTCAMRSLAETVKMRLPEVEARQRERLADRVSQLGATPDADRLEQELVLFAHKMDVAEEVDRLASHVAEVESILDSDEPVGRRLDFLMQELNREANTLSSKSQDAETTRAAVDMKVAIEQMREQIQNIE